MLPRADERGLRKGYIFSIILLFVLLLLIVNLSYTIEFSPDMIQFFVDVICYNGVDDTLVCLCKIWIPSRVGKTDPKQLLNFVARVYASRQHCNTFFYNKGQQLYERYIAWTIGKKIWCTMEINQRR